MTGTGYRVSKKALLFIAIFSFLYHLISVYIPGDFGLLIDPTSFALKSRYFYDLIFPGEIITSSYPSMTSGFYPPGFYLPYNIAYRVFGISETVIRWVGLLHQFIVPALMYIILARYIGTGTFISVSVSVMALFYSLGNSHYYPDYVALPYTLLLILFLLRYNETRKASDICLSGLMCGMVIFTKHNIGAQYFIAALLSLAVIESDDRGKGGFKLPILLLSGFVVVFYIWLLRKAFVLGDIAFFLLPVILVCSIVFLYSRRGNLSSRVLIRRLLRFSLPVFLIIGVWLSIYFYYFGVKEYIYRLVFLGYAAFELIYLNVLDTVNVRTVSSVMIFINLYLGTRRMSEWRYYSLLVALNLIVSAFVAYAVMSPDVERVATFGSEALTVAVNTVYFQMSYLANPMYLSFILNLLTACYMLVNLRKGNVPGGNRAEVVIFVFSVFALNSMYPSNDFFHAKTRLPVNLLLLGWALSTLWKRTLPSRKAVYAGLICVVFLFSLYGHVGPKIKSLLGVYRGELVKYNERMDVYLNSDIRAQLDRIREVLGAYEGRDALIVDSNYVQMVFYHIFGLRPAMPYFDFHKKLVEKDLPDVIIKRMEEEGITVVVLNEEDYMQMETGNYLNMNLIPLYEYIKRNYRLTGLVRSTPQLEKQHLRGCAVMLRI